MLVELVYCGQMVAWIKMPLGTEVGLGPGDIVLDGDPAPPTEREHSSPHFWPISIVAERSPISATVELLFRTQRTLRSYSHIPLPQRYECCASSASSRGRPPNAVNLERYTNRYGFICEAACFRDVEHLII